MSTSIRLALAVACISSAAALANSDTEKKPDAQALGQQATERARKAAITVKPPTISQDTQDRAKAAADSARNRSRNELSRLAQEHPFTPEPATPTASPENQAVAVEEKIAGRVVLALSSSVPDQVWKEYMAQLDGKREAIVVLRGFVGGAKQVTPTGSLIERVRRLASGDPKAGHRRVDVVVDPILFRELKIDKVPAITWLPGITDLSHCDGQTFQSAVTVFGNVSVSFALREINKNGGAVPADVIRKFGG